MTDQNACPWTSRQKVPFGICQIGKAFRNEINPRNFTFRSREFEQMELEYFCREEEGMKLLDYWLEERLKFYENIGVPREKLHVLTVPDDDRAFYSKGTYDIEYDFPFGRQELEGVAYRTDYDLSQHQKASGKSLEYFDEETKQKFVPHVVEPSAGVDRTVLALICEAYVEDQAPDEKGKMETRVVLRFNPRMAPIKCAVFPLLKNKESLVAKAKEEGYMQKRKAGESGPRPFHGYYFRILKRQGPSAPGGKFNYVINGNMVAGYGLVAYPARWGVSGVMTFIVNQRGRVYQKNLGPKTAEIARRMKAYNPDLTWKLAE